MSAEPNPTWIATEERTVHASSSYMDKQKRQVGPIEAGYEKKGLSAKTAEARAWATVNKLDGGGKKSGSGRKKERDQK